MSRERALLLGGVACIPILWNWMRLEDPSSAGRAAVLVLLALAPAAVMNQRLRFAAAAAALAVARGTAFPVPPRLHYPRRGGAPVWDGLFGIYYVHLPFLPAPHPPTDRAVPIAGFT